MLRSFFVLTTTTLLFGGCAAPPADQEVEGDDPYKHGDLELSRDGRYIPSEAVRAAGEAQFGTYEGAGPYDGGSGCSGSFTEGARALGEFLVASFSASRFDGYACRPNTANRSQLSMHGTGRAIDLFVPLSGGDADNDLGDPIADYLIRNASDIGVQFFIWDRTKWNISYSGRKDRSYGGPHPHHDHLHIELSTAGAAMATPWFADTGGSAPVDSPADGVGTGAGTPDDGSSSDAADAMPPATAGCSNTCPYYGDGECDDGGPGSLYSLCELGTDCMDCGSRAEGGTDAPLPAPTSDGAEGCTDTCRWAADGECDDGGEGALYSVCALGTDCSDCGARAASSGSTPMPTPSEPEDPAISVPYAGLDLDGMSIPRGGLANATLERALGLATEPLGTVVGDGGVSWVRGRVSWFGGPDDTGVSSTETGAVTGERLRSLNSPMNPSPAEAASHPEDYYYCAMRWNYSPRGVSWLRSARLVVRNPNTGATVIVRPVDWGPHTRTGRVIDLSPQSLRALGVSTDDEVSIAWAPQSTALGPVAP
jgi:hypothetical protein